MQTVQTNYQAAQAVNINQMLRKTYALLSGTLLFSAITCLFAMGTNARPMNGFVFIIGYFALLFATSALRKSKLGIICVFALTGFMGYFLGPVINFYLGAYANGGQLVLTSLGGTGVIFLALSAYTLITRKDFNYLAGFLFAGIIAVFLLVIMGFFFQSPALNFVISAVFMLLCSGLILFHTSQIVHGRETSAIMATVAIYVALFNLFLSLLNILSSFSGRN